MLFLAAGGQRGPRPLARRDGWASPFSATRTLRHVPFPRPARETGSCFRGTLVTHVAVHDPRTCLAPSGLCLQGAPRTGSKQHARPKDRGEARSLGPAPAFRPGGGVNWRSPPLCDLLGHRPHLLLDLPVSHFFPPGLTGKVPGPWNPCFGSFSEASFCE